jgi:signal transduction histidine kinase
VKEAVEERGPAGGQLAKEYTSAMKDYLARGGETALQRGYEIGRVALAAGLGVLDMAAMHSSALRSLLPRALERGEIAPVLKAAAEFCTESLSAYEVAHRGFRETKTALRQINEMLEQESKRIAHALHDESGQLLAAVHIALAEVALDLSPALQGRMQQISELLREVEEQLRRISHELRPTILDDLGLVPAVRFLTQGVSQRKGLAIELEGTLKGRLPPLMETALYRAVQEGLNNAARHSGAKTIRVRLEQDAQAVICSVRDDGTGFDVSSFFGKQGQKGLGLIGMRERIEAVGGILQVLSAPGQGTEIHVRVPLGA